MGDPKEILDVPDSQAEDDEAQTDALLEYLAECEEE